MLRKILIVLLIILVGIQFIRPARNQSATASTSDITQHYTVPENVQVVMKRACYDCHSNNTNYPWYTNIQPVGLWMGNHIKEGKAELNFSEFGTYKPKRQARKMEEVAEMVEEAVMPLDSYTWIHKDAVLSEEEKEAVVAWAKSLQHQIETDNNIKPKQ